MTGLEAAKKLSQKYSMTLDDFFKASSASILKEKKRQYQSERIEILARYNVKTIDEMAANISSGGISEHPGWEDLIELKNLDAEIGEINRDLHSL